MNRCHLFLTLCCLLVPIVSPAAQEPRGSLLNELVVIEAEDCLGKDGAHPLLRNRDPAKEFNRLHHISHPEASQGGFLTPVGKSFKMDRDLPKPVIARTEFELPSSGKWYMHVRYFVTPSKWGHGGRVNIRTLATQRKDYRFLAPFKVRIDKHEFTCGTNQKEGQAFRQDSFSLELDKGKHDLTIEMPDLSGPDCVVFTRNKAYKPKPADYTGPVWMRFKVLKGIDQPFYIECNCVVNPYNRISFVAGYLVHDKIIKVKKNLSLLLQEQKPAKTTSLDVGDEFDIEEKRNTEVLLTQGEWSPWIETFDCGAQTGHVHAKFVPGKGRVSRGVLKYGLKGLTVQFQAATQPDERFLVRQGVEKTGKSCGVSILMPTEPSLASAKYWVKSFNQWADDRIAQMEEMNFKPGQGPKKIMVMTDSYINVEADIDSVIQCCSRLGFNGLELSTGLIDIKAIWEKLRKNGFYWTAIHHIALLKNVFEELVKQDTKDGNAGQVVRSIIEAKSRERTTDYLARIPKDLIETKKLIILADEPGAMPHYVYINAIPQVRQYFHEFLKENGLTPEFFGKKTWDQVNAVGYSQKVIDPNSELGRHLKALAIKVNNVEDDGSAKPKDQVDAVLEQEEDSLLGVRKQTIQDEEETRQINLRISHSGSRQNSDVYEKRLYHWTLMFCGRYTRLWYGTCARIVPEMFNKKTGINQKYKISPNFQAMPMMATQMWTGAMDLFTWARTGTTNFLMMEDWINDPYRVAFGLSLLQAAGRKKQQERGFLIVGNRYEKARYLTGLALDCRLFYSYSYGLMRRKGPAWSNSVNIVRDWGETLRWTRNVENELWTSRNRRSQVALLVANTSEINTAYFNANNCVVNPGFRFYSRPLFQRAAIYSALLDAGIPVDIVGEVEITDDNILDQYKMLYVVDPHVDSRVQEKIRSWVKEGGVLWGSYAALARKEYDQNSTILNDAFGLAARGKLPSCRQPVARETPPFKINVKQSPSLDAVSIADMAFKPAWKLSTAQALASFNDGSPAIIHNNFGKGQTFLIGCSAYAFSRIGGVTSADPKFKQLQKIVVAPFNASKAMKHVEINQPEILSFTKDGKDFSVIFLINASGSDKENVAVKFHSSRDVKTVTNETKKTVHFRKDGDFITIKIGQLNDNDARILVVR